MGNDDRDRAWSRPIVLGNREMRTPLLWLGHDLRHPIPVWHDLRSGYGLVLSAYQVLTKRAFREKAKHLGVKKALGFPGPVFLDSGGFRLLRDRSLTFTVDDILEIQRDLCPDLAAVLDLPASPGVPVRQRRARWMTTLRNTEYMCSHNGHTSMVPVLHGYTCHALQSRSEQVRGLAESRLVCVGSMVPLFRRPSLAASLTRGRVCSSPWLNGWRVITRLMRAVRAANPSTTIHVLGAGSLGLIYLLVLMGIESFDSVSWRVEAAYGNIQLPGLALRSLRRQRARHTKRRLGIAEFPILADCSCPACEGLSLETRIQELRRSYRHRAIHNAHVLISEFRALRRLRDRGDVVRYVLARLRGCDQFLRVAEEVVLPHAEGQREAS